MNFRSALRDKFSYQSGISKLSKSLNWFARSEVGQLAGEKKEKKTYTYVAIKGEARMAAEACNCSKRETKSCEWVDDDEI